MKDLDLSPRLRAIADRVPRGARLTDVGTDHAYLPAALLTAGRIASAIATDINPGPLERGRETARRLGLESRIDFRLCNGLAAVAPGEADTVVMAGMGGELIARLLDEAPWTRQTLLLLQPMSAQPELRRYLTAHGYEIPAETLVREGEKLYVILTVRGGEEPPYTQGELWAGRQRRGQEDPLRLAYLEDLIRRRQRALEGMGRAAALPPQRLAEEAALVAQLEEMREEWIQWQR